METRAVSCPVREVTHSSRTWATTTTDRLRSCDTHSSPADRHDAAELLPLVYQELRRLAESRLSRMPPGQTLGATALVHEAYLRVASSRGGDWDDRGHFFAAAARSMRNILVDIARRKSCVKHGGDRRRLDLEASLGFTLPPDDDVIAVHEALAVLEATDPDRAQIVLLRYFAGLTLAETADLMGTSVSTVERSWRYLRAWLQRFIVGGRPDDAPDEGRSSAG